MKNILFLTTIFLSAFVHSSEMLMIQEVSNPKGYASFKKTRCAINASIITRTQPAKTMLQCSTLCMRSMSASFYHDAVNQVCYCNSDTDTCTDSDTVEPEVTYGTYDPIIFVSVTNSVRRWEVKPYRKDCLTLYREGFTGNGIYIIHPPGGMAVDTWCDMSGGGWTVFQRRLNGAVDFNRTWNDYEVGFGDRAGEYWLGLESVHLLSRQSSELSIELESFGDMDPPSAVYNYSSFRVSNKSDMYRLWAVGFSGSCSDDMKTPNVNTMHNMRFSTFDKIIGNNGCPKQFNGGWWYKRCFNTYLNGPYRNETERFLYGANGIVSYPCWGRWYSLKTTVMKFRQVS